jgi:hypothetical protein
LESLEDRIVPAGPVLTNPGLGPVLPNVQLQAVYYTDLSGTASADKLNATALDAYLAYLASSTSGFLAQLTQYQPNAHGQVIGAGTAVKGVANGVTPSGSNPTETNGTGGHWTGPVVYNSAFQGNVPTGTPSGMIIPSMLSTLIDNAPGNGVSLKLDSNGNNETEFIVFVPFGTVVDLGGGSTSLNSFAGYHTSFVYTGSNSTFVNQFIYYAAIPYPTANPATDGGTQLAVPTLNSFEEQTSVTSHEVAECVTDPLGNSWIDQSLGDSGEVADLESWNYMTIKNPSGSVTPSQYVVQNLWSNTANGGAGGAQMPAVNQDMYVNVFLDPTSNFSGVVGTMFYAGANASALNGLAQWQTGQTSSSETSVTVQSVGGNWYNIIGTFNYGDPVGTLENNYVKMTDNNNDAAAADGFLTVGSSNFTNLGAVPVVASPIYAAPSQPTIPTQTEGIPVAAGTALASFYDTSDLNDSLSILSATIAWTDNGTPHSVTSTSFSVNPATGLFSVLAPSNLVFGDDQSSYHLSITISDTNGNTIASPISNTVQVTDPPVKAAGAGPFSLKASINSGTITVATFTDPGIPTGGTPNMSEYSATIKWGDGSASTAGVINYSSSTGVFTVTGSHTYGSGSGSTSTYSITVTISHNATTPQFVTDQANVNNSQAAGLVFKVQPTSTVTGTAIDNAAGGVVVQVVDQFGNAFTGNYTINIAANGPGSFTSGSTTSISVTGGATATFSNLIINKAGSYTLTASMTTTNGSFQVNSNSFQETANQLVISTQPPSLAASGAAFGLTVQALDATNAVAGNFQGAITISIATDAPPSSGLIGTAQLGGTVSLSNGNGVYTFSNLMLNQLGTYTLKATGAGLTSAPSGSIVIAAGRLVFTTLPSSVTSATSFQVIVKAEDSLGNVDTNFGTTVTLAIASGPAGASLASNGGTPATATASAGVATFGNLTLDKAGTYTLSAAATPSQGIITGTSGQFLAEPSAIAFINATPPSSVVSGQGFAVQVQVSDSTGVATNFSGQVTLSVASGPGGVRGTTTVSFVNGVGAFSSVILDHFGSYTLAATVVGGGPSVTSSTVSVTASAFSLISSKTVMAGVSNTVKFAAVDDLGNVVTSFNGPVSVALKGSPFRGTVQGSLTPTVSNGVITLANLRFSSPGGYVFAVSSGAISTNLTVNVPGSVGVPK